MKKAKKMRKRLHKKLRKRLHKKLRKRLHKKMKKARKEAGKMLGEIAKEIKKATKNVQCDSCGELHDGIHDCEVQALVKMLDGYDSEGTALEKPRCPSMGIASRKMHEMNIEDVL